MSGAYGARFRAIIRASKRQGEQKIMEITTDIVYVGVNDHDIDLFEGQYVVPRGMAYNSYLIKDAKTAVMETVDARCGDEWLKSVAAANGGVLDGQSSLRSATSRSLSLPRVLAV